MISGKRKGDVMRVPRADQVAAPGSTQTGFEDYQAQFHRTIELMKRGASGAMTRVALVHLARTNDRLKMMRDRGNGREPVARILLWMLMSGKVKDHSSKQGQGMVVATGMAMLFRHRW